MEFGKEPEPTGLGKNEEEGGSEDLRNQAEAIASDIIKKSPKLIGMDKQEMMEEITDKIYSIFASGGSEGDNSEGIKEIYKEYGLDFESDKDRKERKWEA